jgi:hypothetical protein
MTRLHLIAKLLLAAIGVHLLMDFLGEIISLVVTSHQNYSPETLTTRMFIIAVKLIFTLVVSLILLFRSDWLARIIGGQTLDQCEIVSTRWIIAGFRMTACFCGLFIIYNRIEYLSYYVSLIINGPNISSYTTFQGQSNLSTKTLVSVLVEITKWIIAIYLIFGAPCYARWQMRAIEVKQNRELKYE